MLILIHRIVSCSKGIDFGARWERLSECLVGGGLAMLPKYQLDRNPFFFHLASRRAGFIFKRWERVSWALQVTTLFPDGSIYEVWS